MHCTNITKEERLRSLSNLVLNFSKGKYEEVYPISHKNASNMNKTFVLTNFISLDNDIILLSRIMKVRIKVVFLENNLFIKRLLGNFNFTTVVKQL